jgi:hypothetical protein
MAVGFEHRADFGGAVFEGEVEFSDSEFRGQAWFAGARFESAADFTETKVFAELDFYAATFVDAVRFGTPAWGGFCFAPDAELSFQHARIDHPERISFHTVELKPYWFLNVDSRKFGVIVESWG